MITCKTCLEKQEAVKALFSDCANADLKYQKIIELGRQLKPLDDKFKIEKNRVEGCQSIVYLHSELQGGNLFFKASSEALISSGLAFLLVSVYDGETPETIMTCPPRFLDELGISESLTPSRSNGLASIYLRMRQDALSHLVSTSFS
jgi:sulfur transfer protein SufE